jgi:hypothetical protein
MGVDEDGEDRWDKVEDHIKRNFFVIPIFGTDDPDDILTIPLPFVYSWFQSLAFNVSAASSGDRSVGSATGEILLAGMDAFNPLGGAAEPLDIISPTIVDPFLQIGLNRDWKGDPINPPEGYFEGSPNSQRYMPWDEDSVAVRVARWLNEKSGGDEFKPGVVDVSPGTLEHLTGFLAGGFGRFGNRVYTTASKGFDPDKDVEARDIPFVRSFIRTKSAFQSGQTFKDNIQILNIEKKRAERDKRNPKSGVRGLIADGKRLKKKRKRVFEEIEGKPDSVKNRRMDEIDKELQRFNKRVRELDL